MSIKSLILVALSTLSPAERIRFFVAFTVQAFLSGLELVAVLLFSILANLIITQNMYVQNKVVNFVFFDILNFDGFQVSTQIFLLSAAVVVFLVARSVFSAFYLRKLNFFLVRKSVETQGKLLLYILKHNRTQIEQVNKQEMQLSLTRGVASLYNRNLGGLVTISSDLILLTAVITGLFIFDFYLMVITIAIFLTTFVTLGKRTQRYVSSVASEEKEGEVVARLQVYEVLDNYKDFVLNSDLDETVKRIKIPLLSQSLSAAKLSFIPVFNRYLYEALMLLIIFVMSALVFYRYETRVALGVLATFVLGLTRLIPAVLRIQQQANNMRMAFPFGRGAAELIKSSRRRILNAEEGVAIIGDVSDSNRLVLEKVSFNFPAQGEVLSDLSTEFSSEEKTVIVGSSGAGKTTLIDLISGIRGQSAGRVLWRGTDLNSAIKSGQVKIGYVPQDVKLISGSLRDNVLMNRRQISDAQIDDTMRICDLLPLVESLEQGENTQLGDGKRILSGGEIQRIGLARAIVHKPDILILDEFTSSLDVGTEETIFRHLFRNLHNTIVISVAHRNSAIEKFDRVVELSKGTISFDGKAEVWLKNRSGISL